MNLRFRKEQTMNKRKYKSIAIDINCYRKIEDLTTALTPGLTLSKAQVVRTLVNQKSSGKNANQTIVGLFSEHTPQQRAEILKDIDDKMIKLLDLEDKELPWLNCNDLPTKWVKVMEDLRLVVAKLKYEQFQDERIVN
tara:strand:+ start:22 stop:435 length:414 start_codon:yes stop_codon:yes gene_type:complete